jgi:transposase
MARPYSEDLRVRLVKVVENGHSARSTAKLFAVSPSSAIKWVQRWRREGSLAASRVRGHRQPILAAHCDWLLGLTEVHPDLTREEIRAKLCERGIKVIVGTLWNFFDRHGISF